MLWNDVFGLDIHGRILPSTSLIDLDWCDVLATETSSHDYFPAMNELTWGGSPRSFVTVSTDSPTPDPLPPVLAADQSSPSPLSSQPAPLVQTVSTSATGLVLSPQSPLPQQASSSPPVAPLVTQAVLTVSPEFRNLVGILEYKRLKGQPRPQWCEIGELLRRRDASTYSKAATK